MYGTIMRGSVRPEDRAALVAAIEEGERVAIPGFLGSRLLIPDDRADEVWLVVFFTDKEAYVRNAEDPGQNARYMAMREWMSEDPVWVDGMWLAMGPAGG
jgi:antibiotic biosynthesis monooxygenase (ABM) superfamily enzyme